MTFDLAPALRIARACRKFAIGKTKVGAAAVCTAGIFGGCNIEHRYHCHDLHAEVVAISGMVAAGHSDLQAIVIVSDAELFTPCGGCLDWIIEFGVKDCVVAYQQSNTGMVHLFTVGDLMPHYPQRHLNGP